MELVAPRVTVLGPGFGFLAGGVAAPSPGVGPTEDSLGVCWHTLPPLKLIPHIKLWKGLPRWLTWAAP